MRSSVDEDRPSLLLGYLTPFLASVVVLTGLIVLAEWITGSFHLANVLPTFVPMAPSTALFFTLVGIALLVQRWQEAPASLRSSSRVALALVVGLAALLALQPFINAVTGWSLDIEQWLVATSQSEQGLVTGRMSPVTSSLFGLASLALLVSPNSTRTRPWQRITANVLSGYVLSSGLIMTVGYLYGEPVLYGGTTVPPALSTLVAFMLLASAQLFEGPTGLLYQLAVSRSVFAQICRPLLPFSVLLIIAGHWLEQVVVTDAPVARVAVVHSVVVMASAYAVVMVVMVAARQIQSNVDKNGEELRRSRELLNSVIEGTSDVIFVKDKSGHYLLFNTAAAKFVGRDAAAVLGKDDTFLFPPEEAKRMMEQDRTVMTNGKAVYYEETFTTTTGARATLFATKGPVVDGQGRVTGIFGISRDVTERKRDEERIRRLNAVLLSIRNVNQLITQVKEPDQLTKRICQTLVTDRGYQASWIILMDGFLKPTGWAEVGFGDDFVRMLEDLKQGKTPSCIRAALAIPGVVAIRNTQIECTGCCLRTSFKGCASLTVSLEHAGRVYGVLTASVAGNVEPDTEERKLFGEVAQDVGLALDSIRLEEERKLAEEALEQSENNFRNSIDQSPLGIRIIDTDGKLLYANKTMLNIYGYSTVDQLAQTPLKERYTPESYAAFLERTEKRKSGEPVPSRYEADIIRKDGGIRHLEVFRSEVSWNGKMQFQAVCQDVTERKRMEEKLILSDRLASIGELASGVAHEINNPLTSVLGFTELLALRDFPDDVKGYLTTVHSEAERAAQIVRNLLTFARGQAPEKEPININETIQNVLVLRRHKQAESNILVKTRFASDLPEVPADSFQLQQVFMNIITNAEYFMIRAHEGGVLTISTEEVGGFVRCSFADDGLGISPENMRRLFTPFFTTKEVGKGTGLGMSISYGIVTDHNGRIYARSKPREGATFIVELPVEQHIEGGRR